MAPMKTMKAMKAMKAATAKARVMKATKAAKKTTKAMKSKKVKGKMWVLTQCSRCGELQNELDFKYGCWLLRETYCAKCGGVLVVHTFHSKK